MTQPNRILQHATYMITRRCSERRFFLLPEAIVTAIVEYLLGLACKRYGVQLLAVCVLSNHYHAVICDPFGKLPKFMKYFNELVARSLNSHWGRGENFWAPGSYNSVEIGAPSTEVDPIFDEETLLEKLVYVWANPVEAGLVERPENWPGLITLPEDMGTLERVCLRPARAFFGGKRPPTWEATYEPRRERLARATGRRPRKRREAQPGRARYKAKPTTLPEGTRLEVRVPRQYEHDPDVFRQRARGVLDARLEEIYADRREARLHAYLGASGVLALDPMSSPGGTIPDFGLDPALAPGREREERKAKLRALQEWRGHYASALRRWREGDRAVRFPRGTWCMRELHGARVVGDDAVFEAA